MLGLTITRAYAPPPKAIGMIIAPSIASQYYVKPGGARLALRSGYTIGIWECLRHPALPQDWGSFGMIIDLRLAF